MDPNIHLLLIIQAVQSVWMQIPLNLLQKGYPLDEHAHSERIVKNLPIEQIRILSARQEND